MAGELATTFNFRVTLNRVGGGGAASELGDGGFQEVSGLDVEMETQDVQEGGRNNGIIRLIGRGKYGALTFKRGMLFPADGRVAGEMWDWIQGILSGERPVRRYDGRVDVLDGTGARVVATWTFTRALPTKLAGPRLDARTGEVAIEELTLAHEGLILRSA
jgi:phage tail-like protein